MANNKLPKDALDVINKKVKKPISENQIKKLGSTVTQQTFESDAQLKQLIKQVAQMANLPVSDSTVNEIVTTVRKSGMNANSMETLMKMMLKK